MSTLCAAVAEWHDRPSVLSIPSNGPAHRAWMSHVYIGILILREMRFFLLLGLLFLLGCVGGSSPSQPMDCSKACSDVNGLSFDQIKEALDCNCDINASLFNTSPLPIGPIPPLPPAQDPAGITCDTAGFPISCFRGMDGVAYEKVLKPGKTKTITPSWGGEASPVGISIGSSAPDPADTYCLNIMTYQYVSTDPDFPENKETVWKYYMKPDLSESWRSFDETRTTKFGTETSSGTFHDTVGGVHEQKDSDGKITKNPLLQDPLLLLGQLGGPGINTADWETQCTEWFDTLGGD